MNGRVARKLRKEAGRIARETKSPTTQVMNSSGAIFYIGHKRIYKDLKRRYKGANA